MDQLFKHAWILFIVVTIANALILKAQSKKYIALNPELEDGYNKYIKGFIFYVNIPWVIIGIGNVSGLTQSIFDFFNPLAMNPIVLVFHAAIIALWILCIWWVYFNSGAEFIESHPGLFQKSSFSGNNTVTANQVKLFLPLMILGGIIGMAMMWSGFLQNPNY